MSDVIDRVEDAAREAMLAFAKDPHGGGRPAAPLPTNARPILSETIGYVTHIDVDHLSSRSRRHGIAVHVAAIPGTLVHKGRPLLHVVGSDDQHDGELARAFTIERHRDSDHDPRLGLIALGEIAGRALAPATNNPGTAVEVLNALLRTLSELPTDVPEPTGDLPRVYVPRPSIEELVRAGFAPIVREGSSEEEVAIRTFKVLAALGGALPHAREVTQALASELKDNVQHEMRSKAAIARTLAIYIDKAPHA